MDKRTIGPVTTASGVGASAGLILVWVCSQFGLELPEPVAAAVILVGTFVGGLLVKPGTGSRRATDGHG